MKLEFFFFNAALLTVSAGAHWIAARWAMRAFPRLRAHRRALTIAISTLVVLTPIVRFISRSTHSVFASRLFAWLMLETMTLVIGLIPLGAATLIARLTAKPEPKPEPDPKPEPEPEPEPASDSDSDVMGRREVIEKIGGLVAYGATGGLLGWGMVRGRHAFEIDEVAIRIAGLPKALDGYVIAQISDIHTGTFVGEDELREGLDRLAEVKADLVVATGDLVDLDPAYAPLVARHLASVRARDGVVAILGNHDYYTGAADVIAALERAKVETLVNRGLLVRPNDGGGFALLGVDDLWAKRSRGGGPDLERAIAMVPPDRPRILLAHQPNYIRLVPPERVALQLSGHTHGGQINPGFRPIAPFAPYVAGRYEVRGTTLYVNRGFGVVGPPARIGAPPEITKIVLVAG